MHHQKNSLIRLLIVEESLHEAEQVISLLLSSGLHVKAEFAEDSEDMNQILSTKPLDLILFSMHIPDFTLKQAQQLIQQCGKHTTLIAITTHDIAEHIGTAMDEGAQDLVNPDNRDHLVHVIKRELFHIETWRKTMRFEKDLHESEKRCQSLLASSKDAVAYVHEGMHIYANDAYLELCGYPDFDSIEGTPIMDLAHADNKNKLKTMLRKINKHENKDNTLKLKLQHNSDHYIDVKAEFVKASYDGETCTQILIRSSSDTAELEEQINYLHQHDLATGLYNRQYFMDRLKESVDISINGGQQCAILYSRIDNFSTIINAIGISGCDILLSDLASLIKGCSNHKNTVARFGNSSFVSICYNADRSTIKEIAEKLPSLIEQNISEVNNKSISATCSIAVYYIDENSPDNANEIISRCEKTIEKVHIEGGNALKEYVPVAGEISQEEKDGTIASMVKKALKENTITPLYQPIVSINGEAGAHYNTSIELHDEQGDAHQQHDFLPSAERIGLTKNLDRWTISNTIKIIAAAKQNNNNIKFLIHLSQDSLLDPSLVIWIAECLNTARISGDSLIFMINEADAVNQLKASKLLYKGLKQLHCLVALDDFGMGLNPFQLVKHIHVDMIRINQGYMENLATNQDNQDSIRELTDLAEQHGIKTIVPNVNDASILSILWGLGADFVQGDFLQAVSPELNYDFSSMGG